MPFQCYIWGFGRVIKRFVVCFGVSSIYTTNLRHTKVAVDLLNGALFSLSKTPNFAGPTGRRPGQNFTGFEWLK